MGVGPVALRRRGPRGGPTFLGSAVGYSVTSEPLELAFYAVSGGAVLYVIGEVWNAMRRHGHRELGFALLAAGFLAGVVTGPRGRRGRRLTRVAR